MAKVKKPKKTKVVDIKAPLLAPHKTPDPLKMRWPVMISKKLDGIRCIIYDGQVLSRTWKPLPNKNLTPMLQKLIDHSKKNNVVFDGEIYQHGLEFRRHSSIIMADDKPIPEEMKFYAFDLIDKEEWDGEAKTQFDYRYQNLVFALDDLACDNSVLLEHKEHNSWESIQEDYLKSLEDGFEGMILRHSLGLYKHGRATEKEGIIFKLKPSESVDVKVIGYYQKKKMKEDAVRTIDSFGHRETPHKKEAFELEEALGGLKVEMSDGVQVEVGTGFDYQEGDKNRVTLWEERESLIGKHCAIKFMPIGINSETGKPRHPVFLNWRPDLD